MLSLNNLGLVDFRKTVYIVMIALDAEKKKKRRVPNLARQRM